MLYHYSIGFPDVERFSGIMQLEYSYHALNASNDDKYGMITLPNILDLTGLDLLDTSTRLIEMEVTNGIMSKGVYRVKYDKRYDLVLVVLRNGRVKTLWLNSVSDKHVTLDRSKYCTP
jgi:Na+-transporting NADH:ubiquinone oxidoreductase subunit NqrA